MELQEIPTSYRQFIDRLAKRRQLDPVLVVPALASDQAGFLRMPETTLIIGHGQGFNVQWPGARRRVPEHGAAIIPGDHPYRLTSMKIDADRPVLKIFGCDGDIVVQRCNLRANIATWSTWKFASSTGAAVEHALGWAASLASPPLVDQRWAAAARHQTMTGILRTTVAAMAHWIPATRGGRSLAIRCREILRRRFTDADLTVPRIARELGCRQETLSATFKANMGESIKRHLRNLRLHEARKLLLQRDRSIKDVALACGFGGHVQFTRAFKQYVGVTPDSFRRYGHLERGAAAG